jgi:hypothetical protein
MTPDPRLDAVQRQIAAQVAALNDHDENDALTWIEAVSEFDAADTSGRNTRNRPR